METQAAHFDHNHTQCLKNTSHQQNPVVAAAASGSHKKTPASATGKATHPTYAVMIRDAIVLMKHRNGTSALSIAKAVETRHKSHLPSNFRKMLTLQLRKLVRAGRLIKDKSRYRCTPSFKKNPEATRRAVLARKTEKKKASRKTPRLKKAGRRRRKVVRRKRRRRGGNKKKKKQQRRSRSRAPAGSRRRSSRSPASSRGRKRKASPARKKKRASKSRSRKSRKSSSRSKTPRKRQATSRRGRRYYN